MPRTYPYPVDRSATNILISTDIHHGRRPNWTPGQLTRAGNDIDRMPNMFDAIIYGGDHINWHGTADKTTGPEDFLAIPWMQQRRVRDLKRVEIVAYGNHDYSCWEPPYNRRTITELVALYGKPQQAFHDLGKVCVIVLSPDRWWDAGSNDFGPQIINPSQVEFVRAQCAATTKPVWIFTHAPMPAHYPGMMTDNGLQALIGETPNIMGIISGHRHADVRTQSDNVKILTIDTRKIYAVNAPAVGGFPNTPGNDPFDMLSVSTALTVKTDGSIEIRYRNHLRETWMHSPEGSDSIIKLNTGYGPI